MKYQITKSSPPLNAFSSAWRFLELSRLRVLFLAITWFFVGSLIFKSGGYIAIENAIFHGFEYIFKSITQAITTIFMLFFWVGLALLYFRRGRRRSDDPLLDDPAYSDNPSNIYYRGD